MVFSSILFLVYFLPIFLLIYILIGNKYKNLFILFASILFYSWGAPKFIFIILISTIADFFIVKKLFLSKDDKTRKLLLIASLTVNLGLLAYFKYANFFVENINNLLQLFGANEVSWIKVILPIGISFYTFQTLTYSIDIYRKKHEPLEKITDYLLYILSFPQMIAGPIVRFSAISKQIVSREETVDNKLIGFIRFTIGLAKKVLIANVMGEQADIIFSSNLSELSFGQAWIGILAYTFQIYFDFSGYSDMAIGLGRMIGFTFPENFNSPYTARNITDFWRRWHITLGEFMRDYLYIPLGGNRVSSQGRLYMNLWLVFLLSGLWHGASWNFVIWGAYHGLFLILDRLFLKEVLNKLGAIPSIIITFFFTMIGWVIFRLETVDEIKLYLSKLFSIEMKYDVEVILPFYFTLSLAVIFSFLGSFGIGKKVIDFLFNKENYSNLSFGIMMTGSIVVFVISLGYLSSEGFNPFIYFRF